MGKIIDFKSLEVPVKNIEDILSDFDNEETALILKTVNNRFNLLLQKTRTTDLVSGINVFDMVKGVLKKKQKEEDDGELE